MSDALALAAAQILSPEILGVIVLSAAYGLLMGAIPGLTATMAVALLIPLTFFMGDVPAIAAIVTLEACAIFAGDIPATLVRIPGTPSSAAYVDDAYALTREGRHYDALLTSLLASAAGGLIGAVLLIAAAPRLAEVALGFTSYEYFWLTLLGLSSAAIVAQGSLLKGTAAMLLGLLLSTVGLGEVHSAPRFTFGRDELIAGINFIPAMIGLFGLSEVLRNVWASGAGTMGSGSPLLRPAAAGLGTLARGAWSRLAGRVGHLGRSGLIGSVVGMLPGAGADIAAWISLGVSKRFSKRPEMYGRGSLDGIADAAAANNAALAGTWIPALVFGIPGDSITAIVIGVLLMKNIVPGPEIFTRPAQAVLVHSIYLTFVLANLVLLPLGYVAIRSGVSLVRLPRRILMPLIVMFCLVGAYAINNSYFDVWVMLGMGVLGFGLERYGVPLGPVVLGIVLGGKLEQTFIQSATKGWADFFARPVAGGIGVVTLLAWFSPLLVSWWRQRRRLPL